MQQNRINEIEKALADRSLSALDNLATPAAREQNRGQGYRSVLMLSANKLNHLLKIPSLDAECIMLNLEDGVAKSEKAFALVLSAIFLSEHSKSDKKMVVRINALNEGGYDEITYLNQFKPDAIRVPKIRTLKEVNSVLELLDDSIELHLSIETAEAWNALNTLGAHPRVKAFYLGILDLFADLHLPQSLITPNNPNMLYMLSHFLITTRAQRTKAISFVFQEHKNEELFRSWLSVEKEMGFEAKGCISPSQTSIINEEFIDEVAVVQRAKVIIKLFELNEEMGVTGFDDEEYGFIDEPIYKGALSVLKKYSV